MAWRRMGMGKRFIFLGAILLPLLSLGTVANGGLHVHISAPHITVPHVNIGPIAITPVGPVPAVVVKPMQNVVNSTLDATTVVINRTGNIAAKAVVATPGAQIVGVVAGRESLGAAAGNIVKGPGVLITTVGRAVTDTNAAVTNVPIVAAQSIAGNVGQTVMTIGTGPSRLTVDFAATLAIQTGGILQGKNPEMLIAEPFAAALRSAEYQFESQAQPLPGDVKARLGCCYPPEVLNAARWTVGSISLSVPDLINQGRKIFADINNAVTVGHVTVFVTDPGSDYHWWAHEMQHHVQYANWGIDQFALHYVTFCHQVETDAETKAQQVFPQLFPTPLSC